jgi:hypothetical protein
MLPPNVYEPILTRQETQVASDRRFEIGELIAAGSIAQAWVGVNYYENGERNNEMTHPPQTPRNPARSWKS